MVQKQGRFDMFLYPLALKECKIEGRSLHLIIVDMSDGNRLRGTVFNLGEFFTYSNTWTTERIESFGHLFVK